MEHAAQPTDILYQKSLGILPEARNMLRTGSPGARYVKRNVKKLMPSSTAATATIGVTLLFL